MPAMQQRNSVEVRGLSLSRGGVSILEGIDFDLEPGEFMGVVGPNGGGKTTFLRVLVGLEAPDRGEVLVLGEAPGKSAAVGYLPQAPSFDFRFPALVRDVVAMGLPRRVGAAESRSRVNRVLESLGIAPLANKPAGKLSGGERQRLFLARAMVRDPRLLLLDEPTLGVDAAALDSFLHLLLDIRKKRELSVIMVSHDFSVVSSHAERIACIARSIHFCGAPSELTEGRLAEIYGVHTLFLNHRH